MIDSMVKPNMKRAFLASVAAGMALMFSGIRVCAQGTVNFLSALSPVPCITSNTTTGATAKISLGQFMFGLYVGTTTNAMLSATTPVILVTNAPGLPGTISGSILTINQFGPGAALVFEVKGWSIENGTVLTYEQALQSSTYIGISQIGLVSLGGDASLPGFIFGSTGGAVPSPVLASTPVLVNTPEPSTAFFGGLGIAVLAFVRRRRA